MEIIRKNIYVICISLCFVSVFFSLIDNALQRDLFYVASYLAVTGILLERKNITFKSNSVFNAIIFIGLIKIIWTIFLYGFNDFGYGNVQLNAGKKMIAGGILALYIHQHLNSGCYAKFNHKKILLFVFSLAFFFTTAYGVYQIYNGAERIEFSTNRATIAAYIYSTLSLLLIYLLVTNKIDIRWKCVHSTFITFISFLVIVMTGTRAVIFSYPFMIMIIFLFHYRKLSLRILTVLGCLLSLACYISYDDFIKPKIQQTKKELHLYKNGNDSSSLGSRFSLWVVGGHIFLNHPYGNTVENRRIQADDTVLNTPENKTALTYIDTHLHNELLESASLQGVVGLLSVFAFYSIMLIRAIRKRLTPVLIIAMCMIIYGITDVLLISSESIMFFILTLALFSRVEIFSSAVANKNATSE